MNQEKSILKEFIRYASMNVMGMFGLSCYILADTFFVARGLGSEGLAALNLAIPIYSFVHGSGLMLGIGGATKYSIFRGQKAKENANQVFSNTVMAAVVIAMIFMVIGLGFSGKIAAVLGANGDVYKMTETYLRVILLFAPAFIMNDVMIAFVRNDGAPGLAMVAMTAGSFANIVLDYIFIFPMNMGIFGAVLATGFAPVISMGILFIHRIRGSNQFHLRKVLPGLTTITSLMALGIPSLVTEVASGVVIIVFNYLILGLEGNIGVAAYGVVANLSLVVMAIYTGIAQGMQPLTSRAYGRGRSRDVRKILGYALGTMMVFSVVVYLLIYFGADTIAMVFNNTGDTLLQEIAVIGLHIYFLAIPFAGFNIIMSMVFTSVEKALPAQGIALLRGLFLIIPMAFLLAYLAGMTGVWLTFPITEGLVSIVAGYLLTKLFRRRL